MSRERINIGRPVAPEGSASINDRSINEAFSDTVDHVLRESIFPGTFGCALADPDLGLYIAEREPPLNPSDFQNGFAYEELFHRHIFPGQKYSKCLVVLEGEEGIGKSTFLRFYFDFYLRQYFRSPYAFKDFGHEAVGSLIKRVVPLYVDLRRCTSIFSLDEKIYDEFRNCIQARFPGLSTEHLFGMWERKARWSDPVHEVSAKSFPSIAEYRAAQIKQYFSSDKVFVQEALWYLGRKRLGNEREYFLCVIFDNADQLPIGSQRELLQTALRWVEESVRIDIDPIQSTGVWRVIVSLRSETLRNLSKILRPISFKSSITLGEPKVKNVLKKRSEELIRLVSETRIQVDRNYFDAEQKITVYSPLCSGDAARHLADMITLEYGEGVSLAGRTLVFGEKTKDFIRLFCSGSLRRQMRLRRRIARSVGIAEVVHRLARRNLPEIQITDYVFLDAAIVGGSTHFDRNDEENDLINIFDTTSDDRPKTAYSVLLGPFLLHLIRKRVHKKTDLLRMFEKLGFAAEDVEDALRVFINKSACKYCVTDTEDDVLVFPEELILQAHYAIMTAPAYIDNMAIVTPVETDILSDMKHTSSYDPAQFQRRVKTSLRFLRQVRTDETAVCTWKRNFDVSATEFQRFFNSFQFPSFYRKASYEYRSRLENLREEPRRLAEVLSSKEWDELLADDVLNVSSRMANETIRAQIPSD